MKITSQRSNINSAKWAALVFLRNKPTFRHSSDRPSHSKFKIDKYINPRFNWAEFSVFHLDACSPLSFQPSLDSRETYFSASSASHSCRLSYSKRYPWMKTKLRHAALLFPCAHSESIVPFRLSLSLSLWKWGFWTRGCRKPRELEPRWASTLAQMVNMHSWLTNSQSGIRFTITMFLLDDYASWQQKKQQCSGKTGPSDLRHDDWFELASDLTFQWVSWNRHHTRGVWKQTREPSALNMVMKRGVSGLRSFD